MSECLRCDTVGVFNTFLTKENEKVCEICFKDIEIQSLKAENEKLRDLLTRLVEDIETPSRLGFKAIPNPNWKTLNEANQALKELE